MTILWVRPLVGVLFSAMLFSALVLSVGAQGTDSSAGDSAAYYKAKCAMCHGQKAEKKFDAALPEAEMVDAILQGKKAEKPPNMPGFSAKGVTEDQAKALANLMKQLKDAPAAN